ncbi:MAG: flagellar assembly peptidoglycan hydrolase FlgJ [Gammaproteobacteria bacterium]|nr:flagellar assembly peptidoglycan hydrolase FlgJ [Gammaproteobacteria bacterium]
MNDLGTANIYTDFQGLAKLRQQAHSNDPQALKETTRQFEGLFIQAMLKSMRQTTTGEGLFDSDQVKFYQQMLDQQLSVDLGRGQGIGLAKVLYRQLGGVPEEASTPKPLNWPYSTTVVASERLEATDQNNTTAPDGQKLSQDQFVQRLWPAAEKAGRSLGVAPEVLIAQAALETGWGQHMVHDAKGESSHNLFGIKADRRWQGPWMGMRTLEYQDGIAVQGRAAFRAYGSVEASFVDYVRFLQQNPRYGSVLEQGQNPEAFLQGLQEAGYATDPNYASKIRSILSMPSFQQTVAQLKHS